VLKDNVSILTILAGERHVYQHWISKNGFKQPGLIQIHNNVSAHLQ
jgi:hypothetical protein